MNVTECSMVNTGDGCYSAGRTESKQARFGSRGGGGPAARGSAAVHVQRNLGDAPLRHWKKGARWPETSGGEPLPRAVARCPALRRRHPRRRPPGRPLRGCLLGLASLGGLVGLGVDLLKEGRVFQDVRQDHEAHVRAAQKDVGKHLDLPVLHRLCAVGEVDVHVVLRLVELSPVHLAVLELDGDGVPLRVVQHLDGDADIRHALLRW
mmetsp:Transcript_18497/g.62215  ORF Transcript_18497/g.62215 Transcript_18497/m.62215 type:complete len:208 (+) Transcript_18497:151-774(+)